MTTGSVEEKIESVHTKRLPIDTGWAWVILVGFGLANFICLGFYKSFGIFFVEIQETFQTSASVTSLLSSLHSGIFSVSGLLVMMVGLSVMSSRQAVMTAGITSAAGFLLIGFAPSVEVVIVGYGVLCGIGFSFAFGPSTAICGKYFDKKRGTAMGLGKTIGGVGSLIYPVILRRLLDEYSVRGAAIVLAGFMLNLVVVGALMRPLEFYSKRKKTSTSSEKPDSENIAKAVEQNECNGYSAGNLSTGSCDCLHLREHSELNSHNNMAEQPSSLACATTVSEHSDTANLPITSNGVGTPLLKRVNMDDFRRRAVSESSKSVIFAKLKTKTTSASSVNKYIGSIDDLGISLCNLHCEQGVNSHERKDSLDTTNKKESERTACQQCSSLVDCSMLSNIPFLMLVCAGFFTLPGNVLLSIFLPPHLKDIGIDKSSTIIIISVSAAADMLGRLSCGIIADRKWLKSHHIIMIALVVTGTCLNASRLSSAFEFWVVIALLHGLMAGVYPVLFVVTIVEFVGLNKLTSGLGVFVLCHGMSLGINSYISGAIRDVTGSYLVSFHVLGVFHFLAAVILLLEPLARRKQEQKEAKRRKNVLCISSKTDK